MTASLSEVKAYLSDIKQAVASGNYRLEINSKRPANRQLFTTYQISEKDVPGILLSLTPQNFSETVQNEHKGYEHEVLYIFGTEVQLTERFGTGQKLVPLYIKFNKLESGYTIVISFHEQKYPLHYPFK